MADGSLREGSEARMEAEKETDEMAASFHVSIGWALKPPEEVVLGEWTRLDGDGEEGFEIKVENVKVKMGNGVSMIALSEKRESRNGILEH